MKKIVTIIIVVLIVTIGAAVWSILRHGISARENPTKTEEIIARGMRRFAIPAAMRDLRNPVPLTGAVLAEGRAHWADHCATCHANDGSGQTEMGVNMYPKVPDMRAPRTQSLSDGELFAIIKNGVRLTGMPAWGDAAGHDDADNWKLVHFIRHLPKITPAEVEQMKAMNPMTPAEMKERRAEENFLSGRN
jgi:mono/diheme cytochrome c family protein